MAIYRPSWDVAVRCGLQSRHSGPHGPSKPALAQEHSPTSRKAAGAIEPIRGALKARVYEAILMANGLTAQELEAATGLAGNTVRPRIVELVEAGAVMDSGTTRKTVSGRAAVIWIAKRPE